MATRGLHEQGMDRMTSTLPRSIGRRQQRIDELEYRVRDRMRHEMASRRRRFDALLARLRRQELRLRFAEARRPIDAAGASMEHRTRLLATHSRCPLDPLAAHAT